MVSNIKRSPTTKNGEGSSQSETASTEPPNVVPFPASGSQQHTDSCAPHIINKKKIRRKKETPKVGKHLKLGRPRTHGLSGTGTYRSWWNARQRCQNPNLPQFKDYGGRGIEFRLTLEELVDEIGPRPEGHTLDRIDPDGNYEVGNVRWATPREQARNRRPAGQYRERAVQRIAGQHLAWVEVAGRWNLSVRRVNEGPLSDPEMEELRRLAGGSDLPRASFDLGHPFDPASPASGHVELPSITEPGQSVTVRVEPQAGNSGADFRGRGVLLGLVQTPPRCNVNEREQALFNQFLQRFGADLSAGLCYTAARDDGARYDAWPAPPEVRLMAIAAHLLSKPASAHLMPMADVSAQLARDHWGDLLARFLFVPDFHVEGPKGFGVEPWRVDELRDLLEMRLTRRLPTVLCADDPWALDPQIGEIINRQFMIVRPGDVQIP